jgi:hypothetical protein
MTHIDQTGEILSNVANPHDPDPPDVAMGSSRNR